MEVINDEIIIIKNMHDYLNNKYECTITAELDKMAGLTSEDLFHHYLLIDHIDLEEHTMCIRVPGGTVGVIEFDDDNTITNLHVDTDYVIKTYWRNVNKHLKKYIGKKFKLVNDEEN